MKKNYDKEEILKVFSQTNWVYTVDGSMLAPYALVEFKDERGYSIIFHNNMNQHLNECYLDENNNIIVGRRSLGGSILKGNNINQRVNEYNNRISYIVYNNCYIIYCIRFYDGIFYYENTNVKVYYI